MTFRPVSPFVPRPFNSVQARMYDTAVDNKYSAAEFEDVERSKPAPEFETHFSFNLSAHILH